MRQKVESSMMLAVTYNNKTEILDIEFHNGEIHRYYDVPECILAALLSAESKGRFFNFLIKGAFQCERIRDVGGRVSFPYPPSQMAVA